jgi:Fe-S-cluster containining protein
VRRRYFEWDYVANRVIEWVRVGDCCQCGACCRVGIGFTFHEPYKAQKAGGHETDGKGIWQEVRVGRWRHFFRIEYMALKGRGCPSLERGLCTEYGTRPWICREWPFSPRCIEAIPECTYGFREVGRWSFDVPVPEKPEVGEESGVFVHLPHPGP